MLHFFLQVPPPPADTLNIADTLKSHTEQVIQDITTTPPSELIQNLTQEGIQFGLKVLAALVIYFVGAWVIKWIKNLLRRIFTRRSTEAALASFVTSLVTITLTVLLIIITVGALGINTTSLAALLAAGGMAIGMALSGTVQNFAGGIMLLVFKPFKAGDLISAQGFTGVVSEVNIVSTKLTTLDNRSIVIPNGALSNGNIDNYSQHPLRRIEWLVDVEYGLDCEAVKTELMTLMKADKRILDSTTEGAADPFVRLGTLKDSSIEFIVRAWVKAEDYWDVTFDFNEKVYTELPKKGMNFPFPQMDVHFDKQS